MNLARNLYLAFLVPFLWACTTLSVEDGMDKLTEERVFPAPDNSTYSEEEWDKLAEVYAEKFGTDVYAVFQRTDCDGGVWWVVGGRLRNWVWGDYSLEPKPWHWMEVYDHNELNAIMDKGPTGWMWAKEYFLVLSQEEGCPNPADDKIKRHKGKINI